MIPVHKMQFRNSACLHISAIYRIIQEELVWRSVYDHTSNFVTMRMTCQDSACETPSLEPLL